MSDQISTVDDSDYCVSGSVINLNHANLTIIGDSGNNDLFSSYGSETVDWSNYIPNNGVTIDLAGSNNTILLNGNTIESGAGGVFYVKLAGSGNCISISDYVSTVSNYNMIDPGPLSADISSGAYTRMYGNYVWQNTNSVSVGAKSDLTGATFIGINGSPESGGHSITAGAETKFGYVSDSDIETGFKCTFEGVNESQMTVQRDCVIDTLNDTLVITDNGLTVNDAGGGSVIEGYGTVTVSDSVSNNQILPAQSDSTSPAAPTYPSRYLPDTTISARQVYVHMGDADASAIVDLAATVRGSMVYGGQGSQTAANIGLCGMTFLSDSANTSGSFSAVGNADTDTFLASSSMIMTGGSGKGNLFDIISNTIFAHDVITDFMAGKDNRIELTGFGIQQAGLLNILSHGTQTAAGLNLTIDPNTTLVLQNVSGAQLDSNDFILS